MRSRRIARLHTIPTRPRVNGSRQRLPDRPPRAADTHAHVGNRRTGMVADGIIDPALGEALASGGPEERGGEGERCTGGVGHVVSCGPGCKLKSPTSLNIASCTTALRLISPPLQQARCRSLRWEILMTTRIIFISKAETRCSGSFSCP
jgi:hypothetical protein